MLWALIGNGLLKLYKSWLCIYILEIKSDRAGTHASKVRSKSLKLLATRVLPNEETNDDRMNDFHYRVFKVDIFHAKK